MAIRVAILGAGGQVGSNLLHHLGQHEQLEVWGICRNEVTAGPLRIAGGEVRVGSVTDPGDRERLFGDCDILINCAAASGPPATARRQDEEVLEAVLGLPDHVRLIHFSSVGIYGACLSADRSTFERPRPDWDFGRLKLRLEKLIRARRGQRKITIVRLGHVYGAGQWLSRFALQAASGANWRLPFDGRSPSNAVHVRNIVSAIRTLILEGPDSGTFNLFDPDQSSWREVFDWNTDAIGSDPVAPLDEALSLERRAHHMRRIGTALPLRVVKEVGPWMRSLPSSYFAAAPSAKMAGAILIAKLKSERFERVVMKLWNSSFVEISEDWEERYPPYLFSDEAPGPMLSYPPERRTEDQDAVRQWWSKMSPEAIQSW